MEEPSGGDEFAERRNKRDLDAVRKDLSKKHFLIHKLGELGKYDFAKKAFPVVVFCMSLNDTVTDGPCKSVSRTRLHEYGRPGVIQDEVKGRDTKYMMKLEPEDAERLRRSSAAAEVHVYAVARYKSVQTLTLSTVFLDEWGGARIIDGKAFVDRQTERTVTVEFVTLRIELRSSPKSRELHDVVVNKPKLVAMLKDVQAQ